VLETLVSACLERVVLKKKVLNVCNVMGKARSD
jgi:hypothetical protein